MDFIFSTCFFQFKVVPSYLLFFSNLSYRSDFLVNILAETEKSLPLPIPTMFNSTTISVTLPSTPNLPPKDNWVYVQNHEVFYHRSGVEETPKKLTVSGALPQTVIASGLKKYTNYVFYAHYYGKINGGNQNIITGYSTAVKTDEDGMISFEILRCIRKHLSDAIHEKNCHCNTQNIIEYVIAEAEQASNLEWLIKESPSRDFCL